MNAHQAIRTSMFWRTNGELVPLSKINTSHHLDNIKKMILKNPERKEYNGFSSEAWIGAINSEIRYRTKLTHVVFENMSKNGCIILQAKKVHKV